MKKTLVALAALAATASFAQSSVTITGAIATALNSQATTTAGVTSTTLGMFNNPTGTSSVIFTGVEDLGGGMKGLFLYEMDPDSRMNNAVAFSGEVFVGLSSGWGTLKLGTPNQPSLYGAANRNPFGTKTGSGFGGVMGANVVRQPGSMTYASPNFNGFTAMLGYRPEVPANVAGASNLVPAANAGGAATANLGLQNTYAAGAAQTDLGVDYSNGPLQVGLSYVTQDSTAAGSNPGATAGMRATQYYLQYAFGPARVYFGGHNEDILAAGTGVATNDTGNNIGLKYNMGNIDLLANWAVKRNAAANTDQRIWGLGMDYNLSKRTGVIARINTQSNDGVATTEVRNVMLGLIHRF